MSEDVCDSNNNHCSAKLNHEPSPPSKGPVNCDNAAHALPLFGTQVISIGDGNADQKTQLASVENCDQNNKSANHRTTNVTSVPIVPRRIQKKQAPLNREIVLKQTHFSPTVKQPQSATNSDWKTKLNQELVYYQHLFQHQIESNAKSPYSRPNSARSKTSPKSTDSNKLLCMDDDLSKCNLLASRESLCMSLPITESSKSQTPTSSDSSAKTEPGLRRIAALTPFETNLNSVKSKSANGLPSNGTMLCDSSKPNTVRSRPSVKEGASSSEHNATVRMRTPYERVLHSLEHDTTWQKEITYGRRIGFYRFKGDIGFGNFSQVKFAIHVLTKGKHSIIEENGLDYSFCLQRKWL